MISSALSFLARARFSAVLLVLACPVCEAASFLQAASFLNIRKPLDFDSAGGLQGNATCTDLTNHGTHFTVDIDVGTPGQKFSVVADTGSNSLIVPSCVCQQHKYCAKTDRCFTGTNKSSTFALKDSPRGLESVFITFGSGTIEAIVAKEKVTIGRMSVDMKDGILLMVARNLNIAGKFEGILGLGLPSKGSHKRHGKHAHVHANSKDSTSGQHLKDLVKKILGGIFGGNARPTGNIQTDDAILERALPISEHRITTEEMQHELDDIGDILQASDEDAIDSLPAGQTPAIMAGLSKQDSRDWLRRMRHNQDPKEVTGPKGLLEQAGISRFSMCFNDGSSGVLNLNTPEMSDSLSSVGKFHWGLDFRGISVGDSSQQLSFCTAGEMADGQETPCGAIPDSGTTVIMAPKEHVSILLDSLCDQWPRCKQNYTAMVKAAEAAKQGATKMYSWDPFDIMPAAKSAVLQLLLFDCASWMTESEGLNELPPLHFHMASGSGKQRTLELPGWAYVLESSRDDMEENKQLQGMEHDVVFLQNFTTQGKKVCSPAFGAMDYNTQKNGPVWILGTPFFYEFHVGYDLHSSPPSISFTPTKTTPCVSCGQQASLLDTASNGLKKRPRQVSGRLRIPQMDTTLPL